MRRSILLPSAALGAVAIGCALLVFVVARHGEPASSSASSDERAIAVVARTSVRENGAVEPNVELETPRAASEVEDTADDSAVDASERSAIAAKPSTAARAKRPASEWIDGHVILPSGTPSDESITVVLETPRRGTARGSRAPVHADGSFRAQFPRGGAAAWLRLESRYVYLPDGVIGVNPNDAPADLVVKPELGGILRARFMVPANETHRHAELVGAQVQLKSETDGGAISNDVPASESTPLIRAVESHQETRKLGESLTLEFLNLPPALVYRIETESGIARSGIHVRPGAINDVTVDTPLGVIIRGRVVDELGGPVLGARIVASVVRADNKRGVGQSTATRGMDGNFTCSGIAAGKVTLDVTRSGLVPARWTSSDIVEGDEINDVTIVLSHGKRISGEVLWPPGQPKRACTVVARPHASSSDRGAARATQSSAVVHDDGNFEITGLGDEIVDLSIDVQIDEPSPDAPRAPEEVDTNTSRAGRRANRRDQSFSGRRTHWSARADAIAPGTSNVRLELKTSSSGARADANLPR